MHALQCDEAVVDVQFELSGDAIAVTRLFSGVHIYSTWDRRLLLHLALPDTCVPLLPPPPPPLHGSQ
jgi:hypothetical protein